MGIFDSFGFEKKGVPNLTPEKEFKNPICEKCGGAHKTSQHEEMGIETNVEKDIVIPVCDNCGGHHKTSKCPLLETKPIDRFPSKG